MKINRQRDLFYLIPLAVACLLAFYRFPLLQFDDHLSVIREISTTWRWPRPDGREMRMANHPLLHHTVAALAWRLADFAGGGAGPRPERAAQALSLLYALGTIPLVALVVRELVPDSTARRLAFLGFGTFTVFVVMAVTVSNDMAFAFLGTAALLQTVRIMREPRSPAYSRVLFLGALLGVASLVKMMAPVMAVASAVSLLSRRLYYRERWGGVFARTAVLCLVCALFLIPSIIRFPGSLGINPTEVTDRARLREQPPPYDLTSVPLISLMKRPFYVLPSSSDYINRADRSFWTGLLLTQWALPIHLPHPPPPTVVFLFMFFALLTTAVCLLGLLIAVRRSFSRPDYFAVLIWPLSALAAWLAAIAIFRYASADIRHLLFTIGSQIVFLAFGWRFIINRWPRGKIIYWLIIGLQVMLFWLMLFSGPFYYFHSPWPNLTAP